MIKLRVYSAHFLSQLSVNYSTCIFVCIHFFPFSFFRFVFVICVSFFHPFFWALLPQSRWYSSSAATSVHPLIKLGDRLGKGIFFSSNSKCPRPLPLPLSPDATSMLCMETLLHLINGHHHHHQDLFLMNYCEISYSQVNSPGVCYLYFVLPCDAGYTESLMGRRRWFPRVHHKAAVIRAQAERQAVNFCVQGQRRPLFSRLLLWEL